MEITNENALQVATQEAEVNKNEIQSLSNTLSAYKVTNQATLNEGASLLASVKFTIKKITDRRLAITRPMDAAKKAVMDLFNEPLKQAEAIKTHLDAEIKGYMAEQERIRREEEARIREQQRKEQERLERLQREAEERARLAAEKGNAAKAAADMAKAEAFAQRAEVAQMSPLVVAPVEVPKGLQTRSIWKHRVVDAAQVPREYLMVNDKMLAAVATATKGSLHVPGVEFYEEKQLASR